MQHGSLRFKTYIYNKLHLHAEILELVSFWRHVFLDPILWGPIGEFWTWVMADRERKVNGFWTKIKAQSGVKQTHFQNLKEKKK